MVGALPNADCNLLHSLTGYKWVCTRIFISYSSYDEYRSGAIYGNLCMGEILEMFEKGAVPYTFSPQTIRKPYLQKNTSCIMAGLGAQTSAGVIHLKQICPEI